jgi:hypothetical protein
MKKFPRKKLLNKKLLMKRLLKSGRREQNGRADQFMLVAARLWAGACGPSRTALNQDAVGCVRI